MNIEESDFMQPVFDFSQFFHALEMIDYQGVVTFESFSSTAVNEQLSNALAI